MKEVREEKKKKIKYFLNVLSRLSLMDFMTSEF